MRILLLVQDRVGVGANSLRATALGQEFIRRGHDVWIAGPGKPAGAPKSPWMVDGIPWLRPAASGSLPEAFDPLVVLGVVRTVRALRPHIVHSFGHRPAASLPAWYLQRRRHVTHVADWADWWGSGGIAAQRGWLGRRTIGAVDGNLERWSRQAADGLTVATSHLEGIARGWGIHAEKLLPLSGGARTNVIYPLPMVAMRRRLGLEAQDRILVHAGQSAFDLDFLMDCCAEVFRQEPRARLLAIGADRRRLLRLSQRRGVADRVLIWPRVGPEALGELLACGEVMLLPFPGLGLNLGRFPNRLGDYLSTGRPVVANDVGDVGRLLQEHRIGLAPEPDPQSTAQAVLRLFADPAQAGELGRRGREYAEQHLAWPIVAGRVLEFYDRIGQGVEYPP